ncbi:MAG TPA: BREX system ATP-binding domain-containing protein [Spirochaetia bacterium]|nr:BREX system ATP-binding domain-containing protein [Spirochaetia bacterium]
MAGDARVIIEGLRSGVPYLDSAGEVVFGREGSISNMQRLMEAVEQGRPPRLPAYFFRANYGQGKTHLLYSLRGMARERNWVVSLLTLSKETPLDRLDYVYPKLVSETYIPGSRQPGCEKIVSQALGASFVLSEALEMELSPRVMAVLDNLTGQNVKVEDYSGLLADVSGSFLRLSELKNIHRQNFGKALKLGRSSLREEVIHYFKLMDWLIRRAGYQGWLILFDEVELVGKLGRGGRSRAYANIGRFLSGFLPRTITVWAVASNFESDVVVPRNDREDCPAWLARRPKEEAGVQWCGAAVDSLLEAVLLDPLPPQKMQSLIGQVLALHQNAYDWQCPFGAPDLYERVMALIRTWLTRDAPLRTWVRVTITVLDIWFQYGEEPTVKQIEDLLDADLAEDGPDSGEAAAGIEADEAGQVAILRQPLF